MSLAEFQQELDNNRIAVNGERIMGVLPFLVLNDDGSSTYCFHYAVGTEEDHRKVSIEEAYHIFTNEDGWSW